MEKIKLFLFDILKFIILFSIVVVFSYFFIISVINLNEEDIFKLDKSKRVLLLGDSQIECGLNDSIITNSANMAAAADIYLYSYIKLQKYVKNNPNIKTVVLGLSYHSLLKSLENEWLAKSFFQNKLVKYFYLMNYSELKELFYIHPFLFIQTIVPIYRRLLKIMVKSLFYHNGKHFNFGRFVSLKRNKIKKALKWRIEPRKIEYSKIQLKYFFKIIDYCNKHKLKLIFLTTPLHPLYRKKKKSEKKALANFIHKNLHDYQHLDYSMFAFPADSFYADTWHLRYNGAKLFSKYIKNKIK